MPNTTYEQKFEKEFLDKIKSMRLLNCSCLEISDELNVSSNVIAKICRKLNFYPERMKNIVDKRAWNTGLSMPRKSVFEIMNRQLLKQRLIKEGYKQPVCEQCGWDYKKHLWWENVENKENCPLELHHKDGNGKNNNLENIQILCPNCHSLTKTYRSRKRDQSNEVKIGVVLETVG